MPKYTRLLLLLLLIKITVTNHAEAQRLIGNIGRVDFLYTQFEFDGKDILILNNGGFASIYSTAGFSETLSRLKVYDGNYNHQAFSFVKNNEHAYISDGNSLIRLTKGSSEVDNLSRKIGSGSVKGIFTIDSIPYLIFKRAVVGMPDLEIWSLENNQFKKVDFPPVFGSQFNRESFTVIGSKLLIASYLNITTFDFSDLSVESVRLPNENLGDILGFKQVDGITLINYQTNDEEEYFSIIDDELNMSASFQLDYSNLLRTHFQIDPANSSRLIIKSTKNIYSYNLESNQLKELSSFESFSSLYPNGETTLIFAALNNDKTISIIELDTSNDTLTELIEGIGSNEDKVIFLPHKNGIGIITNDQVFLYKNGSLNPHYRLAPSWKDRSPFNSSIVGSVGNYYITQSGNLFSTHSSPNFEIKVDKFEQVVQEANGIHKRFDVGQIAKNQLTSGLITFKVINHGSAELVINKISSSSEEVFFNPDGLSLTVAPHDSTYFKTGILSRVTGKKEYSIYIETNDKFNPFKDLKLYAEVIEENNETVNLPLTFPNMYQVYGMQNTIQHIELSAKKIDRLKKGDNVGIFSSEEPISSIELPKELSQNRFFTIEDQNLYLKHDADNIDFQTLTLKAVFKLQNNNSLDTISFSLSNDTQPVTLEPKSIMASSSFNAFKGTVFKDSLFLSNGQALWISPSSKIDFFKKGITGLEYSIINNFHSSDKHLYAHLDGENRGVLLLDNEYLDWTFTPLPETQISGSGEISVTPNDEIYFNPRTNNKLFYKSSFNSQWNEIIIDDFDDYIPLGNGKGILISGKDEPPLYTEDNFKTFTPVEYDYEESSNLLIGRISHSKTENNHYFIISGSLFKAENLNSWELIDANIDLSSVREFHFFNDQEGFFHDTNYGIYYTLDGGITWTLNDQLANPFSNYIYSTSDSKKFHYTNNSGELVRASPFSNSYDKLYGDWPMPTNTVTSTSDGLLINPASGIYYSEDKGETWLFSGLELPESIEDYNFSKVSGSQNSEIFKTVVASKANDQGFNNYSTLYIKYESNLHEFTILHQFDYNIIGEYFLDENNIILVSDKNVILYKDGEVSLIDQPDELLRNFSTIQFKNNNIGYILGKNLWKTENGGRSWTNVTTDTYIQPNIPRLTAWNDKGEVFTLLEEGIIKYSEDYSSYEILSNEIFTHILELKSSRDGGVLVLSNNGSTTYSHRITTDEVTELNQIKGSNFNRIIEVGNTHLVQGPSNALFSSQVIETLIVPNPNTVNLMYQNSLYYFKNRELDGQKTFWSLSSPNDFKTEVNKETLLVKPLAPGDYTLSATHFSSFGNSRTVNFSLNVQSGLNTEFSGPDMITESLENNQYSILNYSTDLDYHWFITNGNRSTPESEESIGVNWYKDFQNGEITLVGFDRNSLAFSSTNKIITIDVITSIGNNEELLSKINIFPNPATESITIKSKNGQLIKGGTIRTIDGKIKKTFELTHPTNVHSINVKELTHGLYILEVEFSGHKETIKLIVQGH